VTFLAIPGDVIVLQSSAGILQASSGSISIDQLTS
jgi:hypothetical protein